MMDKDLMREQFLRLSDGEPRPAFMTVNAEEYALLRRLYDTNGLVVADTCRNSANDPQHFHCDCFYDTSDACCFCGLEH